MSATRPDVFQSALAQLRRRLRDGEFRPGARITVVDLADELRLSATPVREALSRLAGEGVIVDRRGQGFFVRLYSAPDIADLYRLSLALLMIAQDPDRPLRAEAQGRPAGASDADKIALVDALFMAWVGEAGSAALVGAFYRVQAQLGLVRRLEPLIFADLDVEALRLAGLRPDDRPARIEALRRFHVRRIRESPALAARLAPGDGEA